MNSETKHTPGPWGIEETDRFLWVGTMRQDGIKVDELVMGLDIEELKPSALAKQRANARLISSAPELLAALERAERQLAIAYNPSESSILEISRDEAQLSCNQARAAIAKATGRE